MSSATGRDAVAGNEEIDIERGAGVAEGGDGVAPDQEGRAAHAPAMSWPRGWRGGSPRVQRAGRCRGAVKAGNEGPRSRAYGMTRLSQWARMSAKGWFGEEAEGVVGGEAGLALGSDGRVPGAGGGGGGEAAEEAGELARGAERGDLFVEEGLDDGEVVGR